MTGAKKLIVGLGNPGKEYERTRHNVGFMVADALSERHAISLRQHRGVALVGWGHLAGSRIGIAKPITFMNRSGRPVLDVVRYYDVDLEDVLVIYDDLNLPIGSLRLRQRGSAGGHNGVQSIIDVLGTDEFPRLRIGIGNEFARGRQVDHVLSPFSSSEWETMDDVLVRATTAAETFVHEGITPAMNKHN